MSGLPIEVSVSVKADVLKHLEQNGIILKDFILMKNIEPHVAIEVLALGVCKMTGSLESIEAVRKALKAELQKISTKRKTNKDSSQLHSAFSTNEVDKAENSDIKTTESKSKLESNGNSDLIDIPASSSSVNKVSEKCQKRVRKLKISEPEPDEFLPVNLPSTPDSTIALQSEEKNSLEKDIISQAASMKDVHTNEEIISLVKAGQFVDIVVEKEHHNYIMMQCKDELNKNFTNIFEYEEDGKHKVALELKVNTRKGRTNAVERYQSYMYRFRCETCQLPISVESSVMESIAGVAGIENVSVVVCEDSKNFKLIGSKKDIELMKSHIKEQLDFVKKPDDQWQSAKKKPTKNAACHFVIKSGKAFPLPTNLSKSDKKSSLEVKFVEWKNDISVDALVVAVDSKMNYDKDKRAIQISTGRRNFVISKNLSLMNVVSAEAPKDLKKVKNILHIVLLEMFDTKAATDMVTFESRLKHGIIECINYADREKFTSLAIPHLCPGFCDVDAFIHQAMEALKFSEGRRAQKSASLNSVIFVAKDTGMKQEMAEKFASLTDKPDD